MDLQQSPFAPKQFPDLAPITGVDLWVAQSGMKYKNRPDVLLAKLGAGTTIAGVFTKSGAPGAPVDWSKKCLKTHQESGTGQAYGLLINAGNANVFTGAKGHDDVKKMAKLAANALACETDNVFVCSTGVIGEPLDLGPFTAQFLTNSFMQSSASWEQAAHAIATTDTYFKGAGATATIDGTPVHISGIAKGSGMIAPDMATMLGFVFTDANITPDVLQALLVAATQTSFNAITVDSDMSTSDTVLLAATGKAGHGLIADFDDPRLDDFKRALGIVMLDLAHQIVKDGEGAQKFIEITVRGALSNEAARNIALSIANSPLVKTAIAGEDANWGRVVMAVGKSGEAADRDRLEIKFGPHSVASQGVRAPSYDEDVLSVYMKNYELALDVDIGLGQGLFTVWTCDLTHGYIDINADYRS